MMHLKKWGLLLLAALLPLTGCIHGEQAALHTISQVTAAPETVAPRNFRQAYAVTMLDLPATSNRTYYSLGEGYVLATYMDYGETDTTAYVQIMDVVEQKIVKEISFSSVGSIFLTPNADGTFLLSDDHGVQYSILDENLQTVSTFTVAAEGGQFSPDRTLYYFVKDRILYRQTIATGVVEEVPVQQSLRFSYLISMGQDGLLALEAFVSEYNTDTCFCALDPTTGSIRLLLSSVTSVAPYGTAGELTALQLNEVDYTYRVLYGDLLHGNRVSYLSTKYLGSDALDCSLLPNSPYLMQFIELLTDEWDDAFTYQTAVCRLGDTISRCDLTAYGLEAGLWSATYLPEGDLIIADVYSDGASHPYLIDCTKLDFTDVSVSEQIAYQAVDTGILADWKTDRDGVAVAENLAALRAKADAIEAQYGVTILFSNQCERACYQTDYDVQTTDEADFSDEATCIENALTQIETALKLYPDRYLTQFQNGAGECGLRFLLVGKIKSDYGAIGFFEGRGAWYNVTLDITQWNLESSVHHELWHAAESKLDASGCASFLNGDWDACNPDGFSYFYSYVDTDASYEQYVYAMHPGKDNDLFFADDYALTFPTEDRARLMEYMMATWFEGDAKKLMTHPALLAKMQLLADALRTGFDTTDWGSVRWERYLPAA